jgi:hypothetical protein
MGKKTHIKLELNDEYANALANFARDNGDLSYPSALRLLISMAFRNVYLLWALHTTSHLDYFFLYWITQAFTSAVMLGVVVEIIEEVCLPGRVLSFQVMRIYIYGAISVAVLAYTLVHLQQPTRFPILNAFLSLDRICAFTALGVLGVLVIFSNFFTVRWRAQARASATGIAAVTLVTTVLPNSSQYFPGVGRTLTLIFSPLCLAVVLVMWIVAFGWKRARCCSPDAIVELEELLSQASHLEGDAAA